MSGCLSRISYAVASLARKGRTVILHKSSQIATACLRSPVNANAPMRCSHGQRIVDPAKAIQVVPSNKLEHIDTPCKSDTHRRRKLHKSMKQPNPCPFFGTILRTSFRPRMNLQPSFRSLSYRHHRLCCRENQSVQQ